MNSQRKKQVVIGVGGAVLLGLLFFLLYPMVVGPHGTATTFRFIAEPPRETPTNVTDEDLDRLGSPFKEAIRTAANTGEAQVTVDADRAGRFYRALMELASREDSSNGSFGYLRYQGKTITVTGATM